ncbi:hypothetical protein [Legionella longbeachae]|uniref:Uncharacterized protein n=1 Tax=Legionella longbeachae serogroup 1 (strain NSW150) TaxID=661367 RepID=D3HRB5_LEGLN|nr:hypothetical protein [Legionella longbeachae]VEE01951.1 Uncharacterised protein [Legionella oakridgensis]HBD7396797.1 hypothetical protein [Legionella pneumophila]ARB91736.1 hypothetical protein A6J40_05870 [Legionella longbeachae]ARM35119.1 hypothetical protein B0B39_17085 [Legionella longbeachae]EEZ95445.1 hypothetical protein LLB_0619 [Legionella longbeachae D-4968]
MKKCNEIDTPLSTGTKKENGRYECFIKEMKTFENRLDFFNQKLDKALKNPNSKNLIELQECTENLPLSHKSPKK